MCCAGSIGAKSASAHTLRARYGIAGTEPTFVAVQCLHQHNAPIVDERGQQLISATKQPLPLADLESFHDAVNRLADAVAESVKHFQDCDGLSVGQAKVDRVASSRRIPNGDGTVQVRFSSAAEAELRALPEGLIDPELRTITFMAGERPLARLHYYATHPQSYYGDGRASSEFPGLARDRLEREEGVPQIYFTGCAGNVAAGKYNDGSPRARVELTERLLQGMRAAIAASRPRPIGQVGWRTVDVMFKPRDDARYGAATSEADMHNLAGPPTMRLQAALNLSWRTPRAD